jgi:hypothetical protein
MRPTLTAVIHPPRCHSERSAVESKNLLLGTLAARGILSGARLVGQGFSPDVRKRPIMTWALAPEGCSLPRRHHGWSRFHERRLLPTGYWLLSTGYSRITKFSGLGKARHRQLVSRLSSHSGGGALKTTLAPDQREPCDLRHSRSIPHVEIRPATDPVTGSNPENYATSAQRMPARYSQPRSTRKPNDGH